MLLLEDALVVTLDRNETAIGELTVAVDADRISAVGERDALRARYPNADRSSFAKHLLIPGLVNAHLHPELHLLKGALEELELHGWGDAHHFDAALRLLSSDEGQAAQRAGVRASLAACALNGCTMVACYGISDGGDRICAEALLDLGLRGHVTVRDINFSPVADLGVPHVFRLHAEETLTPAELRAAAAAMERGDWLVMHAAETRYRIELIRKAFGTTTIRLLDQWRLLSERMLLSHAVHIDAAERDLIVKRRAPVLSSPSAEMKLADGIAPVAELVSAGARVGLGTDCAVCNNGDDMLLEARQLGLSQKLRYGAGTLDAEQILRIATGGGADSLGRSDLGVIAAGRPADIVAIDISNLRLQPLIHRGGYTNVAANIVYAATAQDVKDVMVAGRWIVRDRQLLTADLEQILAELNAAASWVHDRIV